jgi:general secretion pathway protein F
MPLFHYRATDAGGAIVTGTLEAREERLVVQHLQQGGLIPLRVSLEEVQAKWPGLPSGWWRRKVPFQAVVHFTQELATLLKAGLPLDRSLKALLAVTNRPSLKALLSQLIRDLQGGKTFADALGRHRAFSPVYVNLVQAGETGGFLETVLDRLADYLKTVSEFRSFLITSLIYPLILTGVGGFTLVLMLGYVVPTFAEFFKEMGQPLFFSTQILMTLSWLLRSYWWLGLLLVGALVFVALRLSRTPQGRLAVDRVKLKAPLVGNMLRRVAAAFFAKTLGTLLQNGVSVVVSLRIVVDTVANRHLSQSLSGMVAEMEKGQSLSSQLKKVGEFPELLVQMTAIGEETGHLAEMLLSAGDSLENDARAALKRLTALLEPAMILTTALVVAFIIVSLLLPILNLYEIQF